MLLQHLEQRPVSALPCAKILPAPSLVQAMGMSGISKSQVSRLCGEIDDKIGGFLERPLEGDWPYLWLDATYVKVREAGRIVSVVVTIAVAVNDQGRREVLGMAVGGLGGRDLLDRLPAFPGAPRAPGRQAGDLRRPQGSQGRGHPHPRRHLATMPRALHPQPLGPCRQAGPGRRLGLHRHRLRPEQRRGRQVPVAPHRRPAPAQGAEARFTQNAVSSLETSMPTHSPMVTLLGSSIGARCPRPRIIGPGE